jgi:hypothetical protein
VVSYFLGSLLIFLRFFVGGRGLLAKWKACPALVEQAGFYDAIPRLPLMRCFESSGSPLVMDCFRVR